MRKIRTTIQVALMFLLGVTLVNAAPISNLVTFDNTSDLTTLFNSDGSPQFTNVASEGINNTGAINVPSGSNDIWTTKQGYSVAGAGDVYTFSAYFKIKENNGYGGLGFSNGNQNTTDFYGSPAQGIGVYFHGGGGAFVNNRSTSLLDWFGQVGDLVLGNWYQMVFKVTAKGSNTFDLNLQIWNSDASGNIGTLFTEQSLNDVVNTQLGSATMIYGYFSAAGSRMEKIDDFNMVLDGGTTFVEAGLPVVLTSSVSNISSTSAVSGGNVTDDQGAEVTVKGVCWNTEGTPTTIDGCSNDGTGTGAYESTLTDLIPWTTYYVRSFATNSEGTSYGSENTFTTGAGAPLLLTSTVLDITTTSATAGGEVTDDQGSEITERGVCWNTTGTPTTIDDCFDNGIGTGSFEIGLVDLLPSTTYYVRAYAINSVGTSYGTERSFTTQDLPIPPEPTPDPLPTPKPKSTKIVYSTYVPTAETVVVPEEEETIVETPILEQPIVEKPVVTEPKEDTSTNEVKEETKDPVNINWIVIFLILLAIAGVTALYFSRKKER